MRPFVIGVTGRKGRGKTTFANFLAPLLEKRLGFQVPLFSMAGRLKVSVSALFDIYHMELEKMKNRPDVRVQVVVPDAPPLFDVSLRQFLQRYGDEAHRQVFGEDFWVRHLPPIPTVGIIHDIRYPNEVAVCDFLVGIVRPIEGENGEESKHASEVETDRVMEESDVIVMNNSGLAELEMAAMAIGELILLTRGGRGYEG